MKSITFVFAIVGAIIGKITGDIPGCDYFDTVDLTNIKKFPNGTYQYEDILIPAEKVGQYDYQILSDGEKKSVPDHTRGCACQVKSCIRFCCDPQKLLIEDQGKCGDHSDLNYNYVLNITMNDGTEEEKHVLEFIVQKHLPVPCANHLYLNAAESEEHGWTLFENGTLVRHGDGESLSKKDYCLQPIDIPDGQFNYTLVPHHCLPPIDKTNTYVQLVSVFFLTLTIIIYLLLPNFTVLHIKCSILYFICLTLAFLLLAITTFEWIERQDGFWCFLIGYAGYYIVMATFLWLLIINYNLWKTFQNIGVTRKSQFTYYNIFVWSAAAVLLLITCLVDVLYKGDDDDDNSNIAIWKPGVGFELCWLKTYEWSAFTYYYAPISVLLTCNITLFLKTAMKIFVQNRKIRRVLKKSECQRNLRNLTNFQMFFRLFIIVGVTWALELISFICQRFQIESKWITFADVLNSSQGIILFAVTILKKDVLKSLADRFSKRNFKCGPSRMSTSTSLAQTEICMLPKPTETLSAEAQ